MEQKNIILTILILILIGVAIFAIYKFEDTNYINSSVNNLYNELDNTKLNENNEKQYIQESVVVASFTTNITYNDANRVHNIVKCCEYLNNTKILKNGTFSFNDTLGPFNESQGYVESTGFDSNGKIIKIIGGGICQVSTTLYNAALMANLKIVERNAHSAPVDYVESGKDATICFPSVDLKLQNTTGSDITVKAKCDKKQVTIEIIKTGTN